MTEQSPTAAFTASSFLDGANADYVDQLQARYAADPNSVDAGWAEFFRAMGDSDIDAKRAAEGPSWARADWPPQPADDLTAAMTGEWAAPTEAKAAGKKIAAKAAEELARGQHYAESHEYRAYREGISRERDLWCNWSEKYVNWRQLEVLGLMSKGNWA